MQAHAQATYEKEVRRARKEAFKASSALVKSQEDLKSARNKYTLMREDVDVQKRSVATKEDEVLTIQHQLVALQAEMEKQKEQMKIIEEERGALEMTLKEMESAKAVVEPVIALPLTEDRSDSASPKKWRRRSESMKENVDPAAPQLQDRLESIEEQLRMEKRMRLRADEQVHFMKMECQFQCCSCRIAERQNLPYVHDDTLATQMSEIVAQIAEGSNQSVSEPLTALVLHQNAQAVPVSVRDQQPSTLPQQSSSRRENTDNDLLNFSPTTDTFTVIPSPTKSFFSPTVQGVPETSPQDFQSTPQANNILDIHASPSQPTPSSTFPITPRPLPIPPPRTISYTKTVTIPLKDDVPLTPAPATPGGISREDALEQIRQRRGRARSIASGNGTPRKKMVEIELRRDISAPGRV